MSWLGEFDRVGALAALSRRRVCLHGESVEKAATAYEGIAASPKSDQLVITRPDEHGIYQVYAGLVGAGELTTCLSCSERPGMPKINRNKPMIGWHPSGDWLIVGVEEDTHDLAWTPASWQRGLLQSGIWLNIWVTDADGNRWHQVTDFRKGKNGPSDGLLASHSHPTASMACGPRSLMATCSQTISGSGSCTSPTSQ